MRLFTAPLVPPLKGPTTGLVTCQGRKGHPGGKVLPYNCTLLDIWAFYPGDFLYLAYHSNSVHVCLTA